MKKLGLRSEIVVTSGLLVGAALLFMTVLLLRLTESRLVEQSITLHTAQSTALSQILQHLPETQLSQTLDSYTRNQNLLGWQLVDQRLQPLASSSTQPSDDRSQRNLRQALLRQSPLIRLNYSSSLRPWSKTIATHEQFVEITTSVHRTPAMLALQLRYPLNAIYQQMHNLVTLAFCFCLGYGLILVMAAVFILNRSVIRPVTVLTRSSRQITDGELNQRVPEAGPLEIEELGAAFNTMVDSLQQSISEQQQHYQQLQQAHDDLKVTRQHLAHSERIASVGNLTSGLAHELGNPLSAVIGYLELLKRNVADNASGDFIQRALAETARMDQLIKDLLDFTAPASTSESASCNPSEVLQQSCEMLRMQGALKNRQFECQWPQQLPRVEISALKLQQIIVNLILNARDATEMNGEITLSGQQKESGILIEIKDNGHGIEPEQLPTLFDPFFTTKPPGQGRGLGLYVSYQLADDADGTLHVSSTLHQGSCFSLTLPISPITESTSR
ncbi:MAG: HAMP domain-containing histidine kinase [Desulfuromonas sp.]|nr:HAMP domain-containing histidine kinase [Desulfuromonas sp.]